MVVCRTTRVVFSNLIYWLLITFPAAIKIGRNVETINTEISAQRIWKFKVIYLSPHKKKNTFKMVYLKSKD